MNEKERFLKERGYDVRTILNYFPNNPDKLEKIIEMSPHLAEYIYDEVTPEDENRLIDRIYEILKRDRD